MATSTRARRCSLTLARCYERSSRSYQLSDTTSNPFHQLQHQMLQFKNPEHNSSTTSTIYFSIPVSPRLLVSSNKRRSLTRRAPDVISFVDNVSQKPCRFSLTLTEGLLATSLLSCPGLGLLMDSDLLRHQHRNLTGPAAACELARPPRGQPPLTPAISRPGFETVSHNRE